MAKQTINIGTTANDGTGDAIRAAFGKVNDNFTEIYTANTGTNTGDQNLSAYATTAAVAAGYQPLDSDLTAISALTTTPYGRALLSTADAATLRSAIGVGTTDAPTFLSVTAAGSATSSYTLGVSGGGRSAALSLNNGGNIGGLGIASNYVVAWSSANSSAALGTDAGNFGLLDLFLTRDAPGILAQRNGVNAQAFRVYNSTDATPATNYDRAVFDFKTTTNTLRIGTENGGSYTLARPIQFVTGGVVRMSISAGGEVTFQNALVFGGNGQFRFLSNGVAFLTNAAQTDFGRLCLGGNTSAFPAIKRSGTGIHIVLADDSAFAPLSAGAISSGAVGLIGSITALNSVGASAIQISGNVSYGCHMAAGVAVSWGSGVSLNGSLDTALVRPAGGTVKITDGSTGTGTIIAKLPTSSAGLASGTVWNNAGVVSIIP